MYKGLDAKVNAVMEKMTLKEKIGQLNQLRQPSTPEEIEKANELIRQGLVGSIIQASSAHAGNDKEKAVKVDLFNSYQKVAVEESVNHIPLIFGRDVIHGHHTVYPIPLASASAYNPELVEKCYGCIAEEAAADNIHWTFSPMVDLCHDPRWGRMVEGPGEDPYVGAQFARAAVKGFQGDGGNEVGFLGKTEGFEYGIHSVGTHKLGTIEQGQSFFAFQFDWFPTKLIKHADSFAAFAFIIHVAYAD